MIYLFFPRSGSNHLDLQDIFRHRHLEGIRHKRSTLLHSLCCRYILHHPRLLPHHGTNNGNHNLPDTGKQQEHLLFFFFFECFDFFIDA